MENHNEETNTPLILCALGICLIFAIGSSLMVLVGWSPPCWVSDSLGCLSRSCASEQIQAAVDTKNLEVIELSGISPAGKHQRKVEFRSRLKQSSDDDC